jgi:hypothetical protein
MPLFGQQASKSLWSVANRKTKRMVEGPTAQAENWSPAVALIRVMYQGQVKHAEAFSEEEYWLAPHCHAHA